MEVLNIGFSDDSDGITFNDGTFLLLALPLFTTGSLGDSGAFGLCLWDAFFCKIGEIISENSCFGYSYEFSRLDVFTFNFIC